MEMLRNSLLPAAMAAAQVAVWPGIALWHGSPLDRVEVAAGLVATVLAAIALGWRRRAPLATLVGVSAALALGQLVTPADSLIVMVFADVVALFSVGVRRPARVSIGASAALVAWQAVLGLALYGTGPQYAGGLLLSVSAYLLAAGLGRSRRRWRAARQAAADRLARAESDRQRASGAERQRLARELHDVSAHHLTSIVVTVTAAQRLADRRPELADEALDFAALTGRETLSALHRLVDVMRGVELIGGPPLGDRVNELAAGFVALGQPVTVRLALDSAPAAAASSSVDVAASSSSTAASAFPSTAAASPSASAAASAFPSIDAAVAEAGYAIVREALTNALRHAPAGPVEVRLGHHDDALEVVVKKRPGMEPATDAHLSSGLGLAGMRERAEAHGGTLQASPLPDGGWQVRALLPTVAPSIVDSPHRAVRRPGVAGAVTALAIPVAVALLPDPGLPQLSAAALALLVMLSALHALPLLWRHEAPWLVLGAALAATGLWPLAVGLALLPPEALWILAVGIGVEHVAVYTIATTARPHDLNSLSVALAATVVGAVLTAGAVLDGTLAGMTLSDGSAELIPVAGGWWLCQSMIFALTLTAAYGAGLTVKRRKARVLARERVAVAASTADAIHLAYNERARIATGLRADVLRHTGALVAAAEQRRLDDVLESARTAVAAMRDLLGGLQGETAWAPQPTAAGIDGLCQAQRAAGRDVEFVVLAFPRPLPPAVDVSAYRVVETALGAGDADPARVTFDYGYRDVRITITGVPAATAYPVVAGLRARIAALGGRMIIERGGTMDVWLPDRP